MRARNIVFGLTIPFLALTAGATTASGHERWFVEEGRHAGEAFSLDLLSWVLLVGAFSLAVLAFVVERSSLSDRAGLLAQRANRILPRGAEWRVLAALTGVMLLFNSVTGVFLAPDLVLRGTGWALAGRIGQAVVGVLLLSQVFFVLGGALLVAALPLAAAFFPMPSLVDYIFEYAALGLAFIFVGLSSCPDQLACRVTTVPPERFAHLPLVILRVGFGVAFVVLAVHNKLVNPDLALTFLDKYSLNFMPLIGLPGFSNLHFVLAAGAFEVAFGLLLIVGVATRFVAVALAGFLLATLVALGPGELVGHLPIIGAALLFTYRGAGPYRLPVGRQDGFTVLRARAA